MKSFFWLALLTIFSLSNSFGQSRVVSRMLDGKSLSFSIKVHATEEAVDGFNPFWISRKLLSGEEYAYNDLSVELFLNCVAPGRFDSDEARIGYLHVEKMEKGETKESNALIVSNELIENCESKSGKLDLTLGGKIDVPKVVLDRKVINYIKENKKLIRKQDAEILDHDFYIFDDHDEIQVIFQIEFAD